MPWKPASSAAIEQFAPPEENVSWYRDIFTGENRTEFPDAPEFSEVYSEALLSPGAKEALGSTHGIYSPEVRQSLLSQYDEPSVNEAEGFFRGHSALSKSQLTSNPKAQLDILRKNIPGLQARPDKFGNIMVRAPGMKEFAYLNKPGTSRRDIDEFGAQTWATLPALAFAGGSGNLLSRAAKGAAGLTTASVAEDAMAMEAGSEQGIDLEKAAISGTLGAVSGGVLEPVVGGIAKGASRALQAPISRVRSVFNPDKEATRRVMGAGRDDMRAGQMAMNESQARAARARGQDPRVIDTGGETILAEARRAANLSPVARRTLQEFLSERFEGQSLRAGEFISRLVRKSGSSRGPNAFLTSEQLANAARASRNPLYRKAYQDGASGVNSPILQRLQQSPALQSAMKRAGVEMKNRIASGRSKGPRGITGNYTLEFWDLTKRRLDDTIKNLKRDGRNSEALDLDAVRRQLIDELDRMVPAYASARGTAAQFFGADDALEAGEKFVRGRFDLEQSRRALANMTSQERDLFAEGFASRFIQEIDRLGDRRNLLTAINNSRDARERLSIALGSNRAREFESFLRIEQFMDFARTAMGNSTTARQLAEMFGLGYGTLMGDPNAFMLAALSFGSRLAGREIDRRVMERVAQQLLSSDVDTFLKGVRQIASSPILDALRAFDDWVAKLGIGKAIAGREAAQGLAGDTPPTTPSAAANTNLPAQGGGPGTPPQSTPPAPPGGGVPGPATPPGPSVETPPTDQVVNNDLDIAEAYRMASEAISQGADSVAVRQRLAEYGIDPGGLA